MKKNERGFNDEYITVERHGRVVHLTCRDNELAKLLLKKIVAYHIGAKRDKEVMEWIE